MEKIVKRGDVCIDVGANVGALTLVMSKLTGNNGVVYAFEPNTSIFERLLINIDLNGLTNIIPIKLGLGEHNEKLGLYESPNDPGNAGLTRREIYDELVRVTKLDSFIHIKSIKRLDFMKVDVEGMEYSVFLGGLETLETLKPTLLFETLQGRRKRRLQEGNNLYERMESFLRGIGYILFRIEDDGSYEETTLKETSEDTLAIHKTRDFVIKKLSIYE